MYSFTIITNRCRAAKIKPLKIPPAKTNHCALPSDAQHHHQPVQRRQDQVLAQQPPHMPSELARQIRVTGSGQQSAWAGWQQWLAGVIFSNPRSITLLPWSKCYNAKNIETGTASSPRPGATSLRRVLAVAPFFSPNTSVRITTILWVPL